VGSLPAAAPSHSELAAGDAAGARGRAVSGSSGDGRRRAGETEAERAERKRRKKAEKEGRKAVRWPAPAFFLVCSCITCSLRAPPRGEMAWTARAWGGAAKLWPAACTGLTGLRLIRAGCPGAEKPVQTLAQAETPEERAARRAAKKAKKESKG